MGSVTAKVKVSNKEAQGDGYAVSFYADYADGRNEEWKLATPTLSLSMTMNAAAAEHFDTGQAFTLTFTPEG